METEQELRELHELREKVVKGLEETYRRLIEFKKEKNSPMIVMRNGKIEAVDPHDMPATITHDQTLE